MRGTSPIAGQAAFQRVAARSDRPTATYAGATRSSGGGRGVRATPVAGSPRRSPPRDPVLAHLAVQIGTVDPEPGRRLGDVPPRLLQGFADRLRLAPLDLAAQPGALFG